MLTCVAFVKTDLGYVDAVFKSQDDFVFYNVENPALCSLLLSIKLYF